MFIKKNDATKFTIPGGTEGVIYPDHPTKEMTIAVVETDGTYPEKGRSVNERCTETLYMISGEFTLTAQGIPYTLHEGDVFMILPHTEYAIVGKGKALVLITPAWDKTQNSIVE